MKKLAIIPAVIAVAFFSAHARAGTLRNNTVWTGTVKVSGRLVVRRGVTLKIEPGTVVKFTPAKLDDTGLAECGMLVKGTIIADGSPGARINFTSGAAVPKPGDWGEIQLISSKGSSFRDCDFSYGGWGLHIHHTRIKIADCTFMHNSFGGVRGKGGKVEIADCILKGMQIGIRYWKGAPFIHNSEISDNRTGIFWRQGCEGASIKYNNFQGNKDYDIKLGEGQTKDIDARMNWWGGGNPKVYDRHRENYIGSVITKPALADKVKIN
ncbi:MAG: right-handed parallel beta-helix repeat-containing protein [Nitrospirota bacterium]